MDNNKIELLTERLVDRINIVNEFFLKKIGESIKQIRNLTPTQAQQLIQILKYGGSYEDIIAKILKETGLNINDIDTIFSELAKQDYNFAEKFYKYQNIDQIPFNQNTALLRQVNALANITKDKMRDFSRATNLGYSIRDINENIKFIGLKETYDRVLDEALLNVGQGVDTFDNAMRKIMKDIGVSGLKTIEYGSGRTYRLDSMVQMHLKGALRNLHNEIQKQVGEEFGFNGYEISVHINPAIDHEEVQGRQFNIEEFNNLQTTGIAKDYTGKVINIHKKLKNGEITTDFRPISTMNCYHYVFAIILGVNNTEYDEEQLNKINEDNHKGFEYEGEHYTMYEGTQLQRKLEREIRKQKDIQIIGKASNDKKLVQEAQEKITDLTNKYRELSKISGLPTQMERMRVVGYKRTNVAKMK